MYENSLKLSKYSLEPGFKHFVIVVKLLSCARRCPVYQRTTVKDFVIVVRVRDDVQ